MVICISIIIDYIYAAIGGCYCYHLTDREAGFLAISKNYNESQTSKWTYQHLIIILRYENCLKLQVIFNPTFYCKYFDKTRFIVNHNPKFKLGHIKQ